MSATGEGHTATINAPTRSWQAQTTGTSRGTASQLPALGSERQTPPADPASWWPRSERVKMNTKNVRVTADSRGKPQRAALLKPSSITDESGTSRHARSYLSAQSASCSVYHVRQHAEGSELGKYCTAATSYASTAGRLPTATSPSATATSTPACPPARLQAPRAWAQQRAWAWATTGSSRWRRRVQR